MSEAAKKETCFPCHIYGIRDAKEAYNSFKGEMVRDYGESTGLEDGTVLRYNHMWDDGGRFLSRCEICGGLMLFQKSEFHSFSDGDDDYYSDVIPVASVEEADLLNILWGPMELESYPYRSLRGNNFRYHWKAGEEPCPYDPDELKEKIRAKYADKPPKFRKMLEKLIREAGKEEGGAELLQRDGSPVRVSG